MAAAGYTMEIDFIIVSHEYPFFGFWKIKIIKLKAMDSLQVALCIVAPCTG